MINKNLIAEYITVKEKYRNAIVESLSNVSSMSDKFTFWKMISELSEIVQIQVKKRDDPVRYAARQFCKMYFKETPSFIKTYGKLKESLSRQLTHIKTDRFSDLIDALPLIGKKSCLRILAGEVIDYDDLADFVEEGLYEVVIVKENFMEQNLEESYFDSYADHAIIRDTEENMEIVSYDI